MKIKFRFLICGLIIVLASFKELVPYSPALELARNFVKVKDNLYLSKYETSNKEYRDFLEYLQKTNQQEAFKANKLDTAKWTNEPFEVFYHLHRSFNNYLW